MSMISAFPTSSSQTPPVPAAPSPLRVLRALVTRLVAADGPRLEHDFAADLIADTHAGLDRCHVASTRTEGLTDKLRRHLSEFLVDGKLTPPERRILAQDQRALAQAAHQTTEQIEALR